MKRFFKLFFVTLIILLLLIQFYPKPKENIATTSGLNEITMVHQVPADVQKILKTSCYDCHSNNSVYPWYAKIQPVALLLDDHIKEGKKELNFDEFGSYSIRRRYKKLDEINEQIKEDEMPLFSYTIIHRNARLNNEQKLILTNWTAALRDSFKVNYPPDSLTRKK